MTKLNWRQKALRPVLNFLVERYFPRGSFFGHEYLSVFDDAFHDRTGAQSAALYLHSVMRKAGGESMTVEMKGVTSNGEEIGDWRLTMQKIEAEEL